MRHFQVNVNGTVYQIGVEEISAAEAEKKAVAKPAAAAPAPVAAPAAGEETVSSPMPGNILAVNVKKGDSFKSGDVLIVLEAMKMENEILAPRDGIAGDIFVTVGQAVDTGAALVAIK